MLHQTMNEVAPCCNEESFCKVASTGSVCTMAGACHHEVAGDVQSEASWSDLESPRIEDSAVDGAEADASEPRSAAQANFELLRGFAAAEEAKASFEARLELDDEDDDSDSEDEFVRSIGRCARRVAVGAPARPR